MNKYRLEDRLKENRALNYEYLEVKKEIKNLKEIIEYILEDKASILFIFKPNGSRYDVSINYRCYDYLKKHPKLIDLIFNLSWDVLDFTLLKTTISTKNLDIITDKILSRASLLILDVLKTL